MKIIWRTNTQGSPKGRSKKANPFAENYDIMVQTIKTGTAAEVEQVARRITDEASVLTSADLFRHSSDSINNIVKELLDPRISQTIRISYKFSISDLRLDQQALRRLLVVTFWKCMLSIYQSYKKQQDNPNHEAVAKAIEIVNRDYSNPEFTLESVASELYISYGHLCSVFRDITGIGFRDYLIDVRMDKAKELLMEGNYSVRKIATMVGYNTTRYFNAAFHKYYGTTPTMYIQDKKQKIG